MIDLTSGRPAFRQIADDLRARIVSGDLRPGEVLPSQAELMAQYDTSSTTVRQVVDVLRKEGLVVSVQGRGSYVRKRPVVRRVSAGRYRNQLAAVAAGKHPRESAFTRDYGIEWSEFTMDCDFDEVLLDDPEIAAYLEVEPGARVFRRYMVLRAKGVAERIRIGYLPLDIVEGTPMTDPTLQPHEGGVVAELAELGWTITEPLEEDVRARMPTPDEASTLGLSTGTPVFEVTRVGRSGDRPVEVAVQVMPGDRVVLHYPIPL